MLERFEMQLLQYRYW